MTSDRRRGPRVPLRIWASSPEGGEVPEWIGSEPPSDFAFCYSTRDLSVGGVFLENDPPLAVGVELELELMLPGRDAPLRLRGRVVRRVPAPGAEGGAAAGMGIEFLDLDARAREELEAFVAQQEGK